MFLKTFINLFNYIKDNIYTKIVIMKLTIHSIKMDHFSYKQITYNILYDILYKIIYTFSKVQILLSKLHRRVLPLICLFSTSFSRILEKYNIITKQDVVYSIEFYNSNKLVIKKSISYQDLLQKYTTIEKSLLDVKNTTTQNEYNFIIYSDYSNLEKPNKICCVDFPENLNYEASTIHFISLLLNYQNEEYNIELQNKDYNYYIVNNKIDNKFIKYYWKQILNKNNDIEEYMLTLCDQDVNIKVLQPNDTIIIYKNNYEIIHEKDKIE